MKRIPLLLTVILLISLTACNTASPTAPTVPVKTATVEPTAPVPSTGTPSPVPVEPADVIFTDGNILTMDPANPIGRAIAIRGKEILAVGSSEDISKFQGENTVLVSLDGFTLMPGFVDAHSHLFGDHLLQDQNPLPTQQMAIEHGVTTSAEFYVDQVILNKLKAFADAGNLHMRLNLYLLYTTNCGDRTDEWWKAYQPNQEIAPNLFLRGIKVFADGGSCKAPAMSVEYPAGGTGDLFFTQEQMNQMVAEVQAADFQVAIHAAGDRALEQAQIAIATALHGQPNTYRHRIEHNSTVRPELLPQYGEIGIVPTIFGTYSTCIRTTGESKKFKYILSEEYGAWDWPWRALVDANPGLPIAWHADYPVFGNIDPIYNMWGMVTRQQVNADGSICNPPDWLKAGALRIEEVLPMMTINSAYALFFEKEVGSLEAGKLADLVILSEDPLRIEADALKDIKVLMTMINGDVEHCAAGFESLCPSTEPSTPLSPSPEPAPVTASMSLPNFPPGNVMDGDLETIWNAGSGPEQWIQIDLGKPTTITGIRLHVSQYPAG
ncbi:MAG TPA: amidohydrolase family protein, partial [Anaerolineales bacterium]|nr:amidohydrolase family protein [Anaerolineales bacterium]